MRRLVAYYDEARSRAKRRRSAWNLVLIPAVLIPLAASWIGWLALLSAIYHFTHVHGTGALIPAGVVGIVMAVSPFFAFIAPSMLIGNLLAASIPHARQVLDREALGTPNADRKPSNLQLIRLAKLTTPGAMIVGLLGAMWP